jgi:spermidine/putrescine transport system permease protein
MTGRAPRSGQSRYRMALVAPAAFFLLAGLIAPLCIIAVYSFLTPGDYGGVEWQFTADAYIQWLFERDIFDDSLKFSPAYLQIFGRSVMFAFVTMLVALAVGFPTAYFIASQPPARRILWLFLITVPYWVNLLVRTLSLLFLLRDEGPLNAGLIAAGVIERPMGLAYTSFSVELGLLYSYLPFMILPIYAALERSDIRLIEAAHDLYARNWAVMREVVIPMARPGIIAGCMLVFIPAMGSFLSPDILGGGKKMMLGNLVAQQFQASRNWPFGSALAVLLMSMVLAGLLVFARISKR